MLVGVVPRFEQTFAGFQINLPATTRGLMLVSRWFTRDYGWLAILPMPAVLAVMLARHEDDAARRRRVARYSWLLAFLTIAGFLDYVVVSLFMPMMKLIDSISSASGKR